MRIHDWNRKFDDTGHIHPDGKPRDLNFEQAIEYIDFSVSRHIEDYRIIPKKLQLSETLECKILDRHPFVQCVILKGTGCLSDISVGELTAILVLKGKAKLLLHVSKL